MSPSQALWDWLLVSAFPEMTHSPQRSCWHQGAVLAPQQVGALPAEGTQETQPLAQSPSQKRGAALFPPWVMLCPEQGTGSDSTLCPPGSPAESRIWVPMGRAWAWRAGASG